jgi:lysophospholipase L1-like esterase
MIFQFNQTHLFMGNSITDVNRREPPCNPLGQGYPLFIAGLVVAKYPELNLHFLNRGIGGNTVKDLAARGETDVLVHKPDWLSVLVGINDAHRFFENREDEGVRPETFAATYRRLLEITRKEIGTQFILLEPFYIHPDARHPVRKLLQEYQKIVRELAAEFSSRFIPVQQEFDALLQKQEMRTWTEDSVHPNAAGHGVLTRLFLETIGY